MGFQHSLRIEPAISQIKQLREWIDSFKDQHPSLEKLFSLFKTIISEWVANVIKHPDEKATAIFTHIKQTTDDIELLIYDDSTSFHDYLTYKNQCLKQLLDENTVMLQENHMGLTIITQLFHNWTYHAKDNTRAYNEFAIRVPGISINTTPLIALIDPEAASSQLLIHDLKQSYRINHFENTITFLRAIDVDNYDLILCNTEKISNEGIQLKEKLNQIPEYAVIPFILINSNDDNKLEERANQFGIDDFLRSPLKPNVIKRVIERVLYKHAIIKNKYTDLFAKNITATLHMQLPTIIKDYKVAMINRNAGIGGGDFVLHCQDNHQNLLLIGDVMGHGVGAKYFEYSFIGYIKGLMSSLGLKRGPAYFLENLSKILQQDDALHSVIMTCIACVIYDNGIIEIANAAHPFPLLIDQNTIQTIEVSGHLLAISNTATYQSTVIYLQKNQKIAFYTDGLLEQGLDINSRQQNANEIKKLLVNHCDLSVDHLIQKLAIKFDEQTCLNPRDDMTLILIEKI